MVCTVLSASAALECEWQNVAFVLCGMKTAAGVVLRRQTSLLVAFPIGKRHNGREKKSSF